MKKEKCDDSPPINRARKKMLQELAREHGTPIFNSFLAPSPPFAAASALEAVLIRSHGASVVGPTGS